MELPFFVTDAGVCRFLSTLGTVCTTRESVCGGSFSVDIQELAAVRSATACRTRTLLCERCRCGLDLRDGTSVGCRRTDLRWVSDMCYVSS